MIIIMAAGKSVKSGKIDFFDSFYIMIEKEWA